MSYKIFKKNIKDESPSFRNVPKLCKFAGHLGSIIELPKSRVWQENN